MSLGCFIDFYILKVTSNLFTMNFNSSLSTSTNTLLITKNGIPKIMEISA